MNGIVDPAVAVCLPVDLTLSFLDSRVSERSGFRYPIKTFPLHHQPTCMPGRDHRDRVARYLLARRARVNRIALGPGIPETRLPRPSQPQPTQFHSERWGAEWILDLMKRTREAKGWADSRDRQRGKETLNRSMLVHEKAKTLGGTSLNAEKGQRRRDKM
jgi:hypothetical protein